MKIAKVPLNEYNFPLDKIANVQGQLEKLITKNYYLHQSAKEGFRSYVQAYASYSLKRIFNVHDLDLAKVAKAYGFTTPPAVNIPIGTSTKGAKRKNRNGEEAEVDAVDAHGKQIEDDHEDEEEEVKRSERPKQARTDRQSQNRRREIAGSRQTDRDYYREQNQPKRVSGGTQWSR